MTTEPEGTMRRSTVTVAAFARLGADEKRAALRERTCPGEVIRLGAAARNPDVREAVASNPRITEEAAERLNRSKMPEIQRLLAENPAVPERIRVVAAMRQRASTGSRSRRSARASGTQKRR